jgi:hypothetical protein
METLLDHPWEFGLLLLVMPAVAVELGRRLAVPTHIQDETNRKDQMVTIRDGLFVLLSLLLGFTLAMAASRYGDRRTLLINEAVSIGTTYLRAGALPQPYRDQSRQLLRQYVDTRIDVDNAGLDGARFGEASPRSKLIQEELWSNAAAVAQNDRTAITATYINSLNETIDLHDKRLGALENRIPRSIWILIILIFIIAVFSRGLTLTQRFWPILILIPITIAIVVALIADLDTTSTGLIRIDQRAMYRLKADLAAQPAN